MQKKIFLFASILGILALSSCSQESEESQEQHRKELRSSSSIKELTEQLKAYNSQFSASTIVEPQEAVSRIPKITYSKGDMVKIAISDVKGGLRGVGGGAAGVIVGAATSSLIKFGKITVKKLIWGYIKDNYLKPYIHNSNSTCQYADSIGYYHNELEYAMYSSDRSSYSRPSLELVSDANARMLTMSSGFNRDGGLTAAQMLSISNELDVIRNTDETLSFAEYCSKLKEQNPEDAEYIDYCAEYIYTAVYANLSNLDEYTDNVMYQIQHSNIDITDKQTLYSGVQIAYASILYSQNMIFNNINN
ncbi:hypothetical protein [Prevotella sp.]|uniref:hypothetical protein n=2 Tax=Prevotella TaxID=838 RepID=UPI003AB98C21